jgi:hypothetical protein
MHTPDHSDTTRRDFFGRLTAGAAVLSAAPFSLSSISGAWAAPEAQAQDKWDLTWVGRVNGKHKAVFDVPAIDSGFGVWRASLWTNQYNQILGIAPKDLSAVVVMRHEGIALAMQQAFWDKYAVGKAKNALDPMTQKPTDKNPVLLSSTRGEILADFDGVMLDKFIGRGGIALACNLAFDDCVQTVQSKDNVSPEEARKRAVAYLVPGVILQPSGVFAAIRAQEAGCTYLRSS